MPTHVNITAKPVFEVTHDYHDHFLVTSGFASIQNLRSILTRLRSDVDREEWLQAAKQLEYLYRELTALEHVIDRGLGDTTNIKEKLA